MASQPLSSVTVERTLRGVAGFFVLASLGLAWATGSVDLLRPTWLWFTAFVGLNLLQSAFSDWCPMMAILRRFGVRSCRAAGTGRPGTSPPI